MTDFPARRIDDREHRAELALAFEIVGDKPGTAARVAELCKEIGAHAFESNE